LDHRRDPHCLSVFPPPLIAPLALRKSQLKVYHRLLSRRLEAAATATTTAQLAGLAAELAEACASSQHTYTHAQLLLAQLAATQQAEGQGGDGGCGGGGVFMRLSQELEEAAAARHGGAKVGERARAGSEGARVAVTLQPEQSNGRLVFSPKGAWQRGPLWRHTHL
jgi:hypothetical protein